MLASPTQDLGILLTECGKVTPNGKCNFSAGLRIAQLALKSRANKNQHQRVIVFVGSPIEDDIKDLKKLGSRLKKNSVSVDIVNFGETAANQEKLDVFFNAVNNSSNTSHLLTVQQNTILSNALVESPILNEEAGAAGLGGFGGFGGGGNDEDEMMRMAIAMSIQEAQAREDGDTAAPMEGTADATAAPELPADVEMTPAEESAPVNTSAYSDVTHEDMGQVMQDTEFLQSLLANLPGVDPHDPSIKAVVDGLREDKDDKSKDKSKDK